jgi:hypothetical protein
MAAADCVSLLVGRASGIDRETTTMNSLTKGTLSAAQHALVETFQRLGFGRIEGLVIRNGEPVLEPRPRIVRAVKIKGQNGPRRESRLEDYQLKAELVEFFEHLANIGNGVIELVEIRHGLPCHFTIPEETVVA